MANTTALDVANFFIDLSAGDENDDMTNMKINKLLYFAQGWSLAILGKPLFTEPIEAWEHGPVVESVYKAFKPYGKNSIDKIYGSYDEGIFDDEISQLLIDVFLQYNQYSAFGLRNMTHKLGTPWANVYVPMQNRTISIEEMTAYFGKHEKLPRFDIDKVVQKTPIVDWHDEAGYLVLPKEFE